MIKRKIKIAKTEARGRMHVAKNIVCQDKTYVHRYKDKRSAIIALADGAGSCQYSHLGAKAVVMNIGRIVSSNFSKYFSDSDSARYEITKYLHAGLQMESRKRDIEFKQLSATLLFCYVVRKGKSIRYLAGHLGDGVIVMQNREGTKILSHPDNGEFANTTFFVTSPKAKDYLRIYTGEIQGDAGFMLMSDGTAECLYNKAERKPVPACDKIFRWFNYYSQQKCNRVLDKVMRQYIQPMSMDDCSVAVIKTVGID